MLVGLADRGFDAEAFLGELAGTGAQFLVRLRVTRRLPVLAQLDDGSYLSRIGELTVRIIVADITVTCADGTRYTANYRLATTLTDPRRHPARQLVALYHERWEHEIAYLALHHTLAAGRVLRSTDPAGLEHGTAGAAHRLPGRYDGAMTSPRSIHSLRHRPGPRRLQPRALRNGAEDLLVAAINVTGRTQPDLIGAHRPRRASYELRPPRRSRTSVRKVKSPLSRYNKKDPHRPERSTPITSLTVTINDAEPKPATREPESLTTALGP